MQLVGTTKAGLYANRVIVRSGAPPASSGEASMPAPSAIAGRMGAIHPGLAHGLDLRGGDRWRVETDTTPVDPRPRSEEASR